MRACIDARLNDHPIKARALLQGYNLFRFLGDQDFLFGDFVHSGVKRLARFALLARCLLDSLD